MVAEIVAIDFDGTIVEHKYPEIGRLKENAVEAINALHELGYYIIIWTCRGDRSLVDMIHFLRSKGIYFDRVNENAPFDMIGFIPLPKIFANYYIDDRNLGGFPGWSESFHIITGRSLETFMAFVENLKK